MILNGEVNISTAGRVSKSPPPAGSGDFLPDDWPGVDDGLHEIDGGSPRSTASQDVGGLSPASSANLDEEEDPAQPPRLRNRTVSLVCPFLCRFLYDSMNFIGLPL